jgi:hypothetical protein
MDTGHKKLGILTSAAFSAGLLASAAQAQTAFDYKLTGGQKTAPPPVTFQLYPLPKLDLSRRDFAEAARPVHSPRIQMILPEKNYYNQRSENGLALWDGATAKMKGPMKVRVTIHFP